MARPGDSDHPGQPAGDRLAPQGVSYLLGLAHRAQRRAWEEALADLQLTAPQAAVLRLVAARPGQGVRQLARTLRTDPMNVQRVATMLIAAGLCQTRADPDDARRRPLYPTPGGERSARTVARRAAAMEQQLLEALGAARYEALHDGLRRLIDHVSQAEGHLPAGSSAGADRAPRRAPRGRS